MGDLFGGSQSSGERWRLAAIIAGLIVGAAVGAFLVTHARPWAPAFPFAVSGLVVATAASVNRHRDRHVRKHAVNV
jgi:uncharacterized membrane protein YoaK (UPF0700 family)